jgi:hypothetical protein
MTDCSRYPHHYHYHYHQWLLVCVSVLNFFTGYQLQLPALCQNSMFFHFCILLDILFSLSTIMWDYDVLFVAYKHIYLYICIYLSICYIRNYNVSIWSFNIDSKFNLNPICPYFRLRNKWHSNSYIFKWILVHNKKSVHIINFCLPFSKSSYEI